LAITLVVIITDKESIYPVVGISPIGELTEQLIDNILVKSLDLNQSKPIDLNLRQNYSSLNELFQNYNETNSFSDRIEPRINSFKNEICQIFSNIYSTSTQTNIENSIYKNDESFKSINELYKAHPEHHSFQNLNVQPSLLQNNNIFNQVQSNKYKFNLQLPERMIFYDKQKSAKPKGKSKLVSIAVAILSRLSKIFKKE
jgi:hypothetical protein